MSVNLLLSSDSVPLIEKRIAAVFDVKRLRGPDSMLDPFSTCS